MATQFNGTIYEYGSEIPGYISSTDTYTSHVWFDKSKLYDADGKIFEELSIPLSLFLGEAEDDVESLDVQLEDILKYLNLHIIQLGLDFYIFDWDSIKTPVDDIQELMNQDGITLNENLFILDLEHYDITTALEHELVQLPILKEGEEKTIYVLALDCKCGESQASSTVKYVGLWNNNGSTSAWVSQNVTRGKIFYALFIPADYCLYKLEGKNQKWYITENEIFAKTWVDIFTDETKTIYNDLVKIRKDDYSSTDTQLTMDAVYNQLRLTCDVEKFDDAILDPFDSDTLYSPYKSPQLYMTEYCANGIGNDAFKAFKQMVSGGAAQADYNNGTSAYKRNWNIWLKQSTNWSFMSHGYDMYRQEIVPKDASNNYYNQWQLPAWLREDSTEHLGASGIIAFGSGEKMNVMNQTNKENISSYTDYIVIAVNGNGANNKDTDTYINGGSAKTPFPDETDLQNMNMCIEYTSATDGVWSPNDDNTTNYLIFEGSILLNPIFQKTGVIGWKSNVDFHQYGYGPYTTALRNENTIQHVRTLINQDSLPKNYVPVNDVDDGGYYTTEFYDTVYSNYNDRNNASANWLFPPIENKNLRKFEYKLGNKTYYGTNDKVAYVPILECQLKIGNKYLVEILKSETLPSGDVVSVPDWVWMNESEVNIDYNDGDPRYIASFTLGFNPQNGDFIIGQTHDFYNNIVTKMNLGNIKGTAIPIKKSDELSGKLEFKIIGFQNLIWDDGIRKHATWFRHSTKTAKSVQVMPNVSSIMIKKFSMKIKSDNGGVSALSENDIIYMSDESNKYINIKDDIDFKLNTMLTPEEAYKMGVESVISKSNVVENSTGVPILGITNTLTEEFDKPEKHYIDSYYKMFSNPSIIVDTDVHDDDKMFIFNIYRFNWLSDKNYLCIGQDYNCIDNTKHLKLREIKS